MFNVVAQGEGAIFFLDSSSGLGKTFVYSILLASVRWDRHITIEVSSSDIVVHLLEGGQTSHLVFKIPITIGRDSMCLILVQSDSAELLWEAKLIVWDEVLAQHRHYAKVVDQTLRNIMQRPDSPFGKKVVVFGGDFQQWCPKVLGQQSFLRPSRIRFCGIKCTSWLSQKTWDCVPIPLQAICWVPSKSRQWPRIFHHWSFSTKSQHRGLSRSQDYFILENPSSAIYRYPHPRCFPGHGNQLCKPRIHGRSSYSDNKKYNREFSQHSDCQSCARAKARIFVGRLGGNGGRLGYGDWHGISQHHYSGRYVTTSPGPQNWRPCYFTKKSRCALETL